MVKKNILEVGKRKTAVARVTTKIGTGKIRINNSDLEEYVTSKVLQLKLKEPLIISGSTEKYDLIINVRGGGQSSQVDAIRQGISKAILKITKKDEIRKKFLEYDRSLLIADTRFKEPNKPNVSKARAKRQKSYR